MHWIRIGREMPPIGRIVIFSSSSKIVEKNSKFNLLIGLRPEYISTGYFATNNQYGYTGECYLWKGVPLIKFLDSWEFEKRLNVHTKPMLSKTLLEINEHMPSKILLDRNDYWTHIEDINPVRTVLFDKENKAFKYDEELIHNLNIFMKKE